MAFYISGNISVLAITAMLYSFIQPLFFRLSEVRSWNQQVQERNPDVPLPSNTLQLLLRDPEAFPGQTRYIISPKCSGSAPELFHLRQGLISNPEREHSTFFWLRTMASDLEELILISAASRSAVNRSSAPYISCDIVLIHI